MNESVKHDLRHDIADLVLVTAVLVLIGAFAIGALKLVLS